MTKKTKPKFPKKTEKEKNLMLPHPSPCRIFDKFEKTESKLYYVCTLSFTLFHNRSQVDLQDQK